MLVKKTHIKASLVAIIVAFSLCLAGSQLWAGASLNTDPPTVEMNPRAMAAMKIMGAGFQPEDRVVIVLVKANKGEDVPVASAEADSQGQFETKMNMLSILQGFFNMRFKGGKPMPDPNNPPLPPGKYTMKATSWDSDAEATYILEVTVPKKK